MLRKYLFIGVCIVVAGAAVFGIYRELKKGEKALVVQVAENQKIADVIPVWLRGNAEVQKIQSDLNSLAGYRAEYGCLTDTPSDV